MVTLAASYELQAEAHWTRQQLLDLGVPLGDVHVLIPGASPAANVECMLSRAGLSAAIAAHLTRLIDGGDILLTAIVEPTLSVAAELTLATHARCPDLIGEAQESTISAAQFAALRAELARTASRDAAMGSSQRADR